MAALDFSKLERIGYRGLDAEAQRATHDALTAQGFKVVEDADNPFLQAPRPQDQRPAPPSSRAKRPPLQSLGGRDYRPLYRAACNFHERHNPVQLTAAFWEEVCADMTATANEFDNDPFLMELLLAVFEEMERESRELQQAATAASAGA